MQEAKTGRISLQASPGRKKVSSNYVMTEEPSTTELIMNILIHII
jgi:hypothetical protein